MNYVPFFRTHLFSPQRSGLLPEVSALFPKSHLGPGSTKYEAAFVFLRSICRHPQVPNGIVSYMQILPHCHLDVSGSVGSSNVMLEISSMFTQLLFIAVGASKRPVL
jgi:hypothetical protein